MTSPLLIPFKASHILKFINRDTDVQGEWRLASIKESSGPAFTAVVDGRIIGCAGIIISWPGMGVAWMTLSEGIYPYRFWMTRMVKRLLKDWIRRYSLHRVEAVVLADNNRNCKWIEMLGFSQEDGWAKYYTYDKKDAVRYELVKE